MGVKHYEVQYLELGVINKGWEEDRRRHYEDNKRKNRKKWPQGWVRWVGGNWGLE